MSKMTQLSIILRGGSSNLPTEWSYYERPVLATRLNLPPAVAYPLGDTHAKFKWEWGEARTSRGHLPRICP